MTTTPTVLACPRLGVLPPSRTETCRVSAGRACRVTPRGHESGTRESNAVSSASKADGFPSPSSQIAPTRGVVGALLSAVEFSMNGFPACRDTRGRQGSNLLATAFAGGDQRVIVRPPCNQLHLAHMSGRHPMLSVTRC